MSGVKCSRRPSILAAATLAAVAGLGAGSPSFAAAPPDDTATTPSDYDDPEFQVDLALGLLPAAEFGAYLRWDADRSESAVQACMNNAGFDYVPMIGDDGVSMVESVAEDTIEDRAKWGFGLLPAMDPANFDTAPESELELVDPNAEVVAALSDEEQSLWYALQAECRTTTRESTPLDNPDVYELVVAAHEEIFSDPRVLAADQQWSDCMADAGQPFADRAEMTLVLADDAMLEHFWMSEAWEASSPDHDDFVAAVERERAAAVADLECTDVVDAAAREVAAEVRQDLLAQWDTIDWSKPPLGLGGDLG